MPAAVLEAWAHELPVFMTDACNLPEGFSAGAAFRIAGAPARIAEVLAARLPDTPALAAAGHAGRALVERRFRWPRVLEDLAGVHAWLGGGPPPDVLYRG